MDEHYVYLHHDPTTGQIVYVGKGIYGRAWDVTRSRAYNKEHREWMKGLSKLGFTPNQWVTIHKKNLTEEEAFKIEKEYLHNNGTLTFNMQCGEKQYQAKMTNKQAREAFKMAKEGKKHKEIAELYGVSRTAISMLASGKQWRAVTADLRGGSV